MVLKIKIGSRGTRGVYLRGALETSRLLQASVSVTPTFRKEDVSKEQNDRKIAYEQRLTLVSSVPWVRVPEFLLLNSGGNIQYKWDYCSLTSSIRSRP